MKKTICVIGSGWGASSFIKNIDTNKYNIIVVSKNENFIYTPLLPYSIFKNIKVKCFIKDINQDVQFLKNNISDVDFDNNTLFLDNKKKIKYDIVVFSHGSVVNTYNIEGVDKYCRMLKSCDDIESIQFKLKNLKNNANIIVIGCGPTGTETIGYLMDQKKFKIFAVDALSKPLNMFPNESIQYLLDLWKKENITTYFNSPVTKITNKKVIIKENEIDYNMIIWCGGIKLNNLTKKILANLNDTQSNGIPVNQYLQITKKNKPIENSYAIGDCSIGFGPPTAQKAYQQGYFLANRFNTDNNNKFNYNNKGQILYIGDQKSIYSNKYFNCHGKFPNFINNFIIIYNAINYKQMKEIGKDLLFNYFRKKD